MVILYGSVPVYLTHTGLIHSQLWENNHHWILSIKSNSTKTLMVEVYRHRDGREAFECVWVVCNGTNQHGGTRGNGQTHSFWCRGGNMMLESVDVHRVSVCAREALTLALTVPGSGSPGDRRGHTVPRAGWTGTDRMCSCLQKVQHSAGRRGWHSERETETEF